MSYTITLSNKGPDDAANLALTDTVPASTTFRSIAAPSGWACTTPALGGTGEVSCTAPALANGASARFRLTVQVACATPDGTVIGNTATATSTTLNPNPSPANSASVNVNVSDPPPLISHLEISRRTLWPPNHRMVPETLRYHVRATCDLSPQLSVTVTSNQPVSGTGPRDRSPDWVIIDPHHIELRAEHAPHAVRVYTVTVTATDSAGSQRSRSVLVNVPLHK